jgi:SOS response regulatory protein OraA/RecX
MGNKYKVMGTKYKAKKLSKKDIDKLLANARADERKKQAKILENKLRTEKLKADKQMAKVLNSIARALEPSDSKEAGDEPTAV